ncbi:TetR family transcriptional regulator [Nocardia africana]
MRVSATRRRGAVLERALLDAVWDELRERGFHAMTMAGVAERAGSSAEIGGS